MIRIIFALLFYLFTAANSWATTFTDLKFGQYQVADSQWNTGACLYTTTCQIYSKNPGTMYKIPWTNGQWQWQTGQYVQFSLTGDSANPYEGKVYNGNGSLAGTIGTGHIINMGPDYFFFVGNDNNTGQLFSMTSGFADSSGVTWTGTLNPTLAQVDSYAAGGSTTPLAAGQTVAPAGPTVAGGTITQTNAPNTQVIVSGGSGPTGPTQSQQTRIDTWTGSSGSYNNLIYIEQTYGNNNTVNITQEGVKNRIDFTLGGNGNSVTNNQTGSNYLKIEVPGWGNAITTNQINLSNTNYTETKIQGNGNTVNHTQTGNGNHILFSTVTGDINTVNTTQAGNAGHYAESKLTGNWNTVKIEQTGNTANRARIDLTNAGGPASVDLQQSGGKTFGITQSCTNPAGCTTVVRQ